MDIQLICSDIDGTLLNKDRQLAEVTIQQIKRLAHIPFILISSRMPKAMTHLQYELEIDHLPLIAYNGGLIVEGRNIIDSTEISIHIVTELYSKIESTSLHFSLYHADEWYVPELDYWAKREAHNTKIKPKIQEVHRTIDIWKKENKGAHKIMVMGDAKEIDNIVNFIEVNFSSKIIGYRSKDTYLEIAPKSISKKTAIETLLSSHYPKLSFANVLAFGDNYNDIEMLKSVGAGVAVANANNQVLAIANNITDTNKEHGVAKYLEKHLK